MPNPFAIETAELMDLQRVAEEFVKEHTEHAKLASYAHTVVWGSRGSGKSMHCRFLEPLAQAWAPDSGLKGDVRRFIELPGAYVGVYVNCREPVLNRHELRGLDAACADRQLVLSLLDRYLACVIAERASDTLRTQLSHVLDFAADPGTAPAWLAAEAGAEQGTRIGSLLEWVQRQCKQWLQSLDAIIDNAYRDGRYVPSLDAFPAGAPQTTRDIPRLFEWLQQCCHLRVPFFLVFDEANVLCRVHQQCINSLISFRSQRYLCIKVASQREGFPVGLGLDGAVDETHDFTTLDLDDLYTNNREAYYKRIERIANDRLKRAGLGVGIAEYLPTNPTEVRALERAREIAARQYEEIPEDRRPLDRDNYVKKYAPALVFQEVLSHKAGRTYAGFDNLVHLSSGIVRSFLDCCSGMYTRYTERYPGREPSQIPVSVQGEVITDYSNQFIQTQIVDRMKTLDRDSEEWKRLAALHSLLKGLGAFFRHRLMDKRSREPRIISISLKDDPGPELESVLVLAVQESFLHAKWYRSKRGNRNLRCYVLNRRLCPHFNLDITGFQGRVELSSADLSLALRSPDAFLQRIRGMPEEDADADSRQLVLFDM